MGSLKNQCTTSYKSSIETIALNYLVFEKIAFLHFGDRRTNKQTNKQMDRPIALSRSRCRERRLNDMKLVQWPLMGGLLHLVQQGGDWTGPEPAQSPPRCTKCNSHPSTASIKVKRGKGSV